MTGLHATVARRRARAERAGRDERGAIAIIAALSMTMLIAATSLAFDIGREVDTNRTVQAVADAVSLDAADFLDGTAPAAADPYDPIGGTTYQLAQVVQYEAAESALRNGVSTAKAAGDAVVLGQCSSSTSCPTFTALETCPLTVALPTPVPAGTANPGMACMPATEASPGAVANAVRVQASDVTSFVFAVGNATSDRTATAIRVYNGGCCGGGGGPIGVSAFSLGSTLLDFSNPLVDSVLSQELGTSTASISLLSYSGLAGADVSLGDILAANTSVGTLTQLLDTQVSPQTALGYVYNALVAQGTSSALAAAGQLNTAFGINGTGTGSITASGGVTLCQLVDLSGGTSACTASPSALGPAAYAEFSAANLLTGIAAVSGEGHAIGISISGLGLLDATVTAVSPLAVAGPGPADQPSCPTGLAPCPVQATDTQASVTLQLAGLDLLGLVTTSIDLQVAGATATATLDGLSCGTSPATETATIDGTSYAATVSPTFDFNGTNVAGTTVSVGAGPFSFTFDGPFGGGSPPPQNSSGTDPAIDVTAPSGSGLSPLINSVLPTLATDLNTLLDPALTPILSALGINLGVATVADNYVNCATSVLVG